MAKDYPQADHYEALIEELNKMKPRGIATFITSAGMFRVDYNFNPPRVEKIKPKGKEQDG